MIVSRKTCLVRVDGELVEFASHPEDGAWYEHRMLEPGKWLRPGQIGSLYMPMNADGSPDIANLSEIEQEG